MKNNIEIVVIEDEEDILELIEYHLTKEGYCVTGFLSTKNVELFLEEETPALIIIDRNLPDIEGSEFIAYLRKLGYTTPVIFLTAKDSETNLEEGFDAGGDDYMTKPFSFKELLLRVKALLKRSGALEKTSILQYKLLTLNLLQKSVSFKKEDISLTNLEFKLLYTFMQHINQPLTRDFLRDKVWGVDGENINDNAINVAINRLKSKIDPKNTHNYFSPVWGVGYKFF